MSSRGTQKFLDGAMEFEEIARRLGTSPSGVRNSYASAMRKLRARPDSLKVLQDLIEERRNIRETSTPAVARLRQYRKAKRTTTW